MNGQRLVRAPLGREEGGNDHRPQGRGHGGGGTGRGPASVVSSQSATMRNRRAVTESLVKWGFADMTDVEHGTNHRHDDGFEDVGIYHWGNFSRMDRAIQDLARASNRRTTTQDLWVNVGEPPEGYDGWGTVLDLDRAARRVPRLFRKLVDAIERNHQIKRLFVNLGDFQLEGVQLCRDHENQQPADSSLDYEGLEQGDADIERFFGTVLASHPSLKNITFTDNFVHPRYVRLFADSIANCRMSLTILKFDLVPLTPGGCRAIERMLEGGARVKKLAVADCWVEDEAWRGICQAAAKNKHLKELLLVQEGLVVQPDMLLPVVAKKSTLKYLGVQAEFTQEAVDAIFEALKTNTALERIHLVLKTESHEYMTEKIDVRLVDVLRVVNDVLDTYNLALESVNLYEEDDHNASLRRNNRIHKQFQSLQYRVDQLALWSRALHAFSAYPTVMYRFLRRGNVEAFAERAPSIPDPRLCDNKKRSAQGGQNKAPPKRR